MVMPGGGFPPSLFFFSHYLSISPFLARLPFPLFYTSFLSPPVSLPHPFPPFFSSLLSHLLHFCLLDPVPLPFPAPSSILHPFTLSASAPIIMAVCYNPPTPSS